jgi:hypothetical protein
MRLLRSLTLSLILLSPESPVTAQVQVPAYTVDVYPGAPRGYYFLGAINFPMIRPWQMIVDSTGDLLYYKRFSSFMLDFKVQQNGLMSYFHNGKYHLMDGDFHAVDSITAVNSVQTDNHELQVLANGNFLFMGQDTAVMDLSSYHYFLKTNAPGSKRARVLYVVIQEFDAQKNLIFEWRGIDHFSFDSVDPFWLFDSARVDWTHSNALELDYDGNILLSSRHFNEITKISRSTGQIMWRFGGHYNQFTFLNDSLRFYGQHDIRRVGVGHVTLYDNGRHISSHPGRGVEYELDEAAKTARTVWSASHSSIASTAMGNAQRRPGKSLVNYGVLNPPGICFEVKDDDDSVLFRMRLSDGQCSYRAFNYASLPRGLQRPMVNCFDQAGATYLDGGPGYKSYRWNNGETTRIIKREPGQVYRVTLELSNGGFLVSYKYYSDPVVVFCSIPAGVNQVLQEETMLSPNPVQNLITLRHPHAPGQQLRIFDSAGNALRQLEADTDIVTIDVSDLSPGLYLLKIGHYCMRFVKE